jgi:hypothetical protein
MQTAPLHWRIVNPDEAEVSGLVARGAAGFVARGASRGEKYAQNA